MLRRPVLLVLVVAALIASSVAFSPAAGAAASGPSIARKVALAPPDAAATEFGAALSIQTNRLVASAQLGGRPLVYVFNQSSTGTWSHSGTIHPGAGASAQWGSRLAVAGNTIAIPDRTTSVHPNGAVYIYDLVGSTWTLHQTIAGTQFSSVAAGVWLSGNALAISNPGDCDFSCSFGRWFLYTRTGGMFSPIFDSFPRTAFSLSVGTNDSSFVFGNPGFDDPASLRPVGDNTLMVWNTKTSPPTVPLAETTTYRDGEFGPVVHEGWYRKVDISNGTIAYENCCTPEHEVRILEGAASYALVATLPVDGPSNWLSVVPRVVLLADSTRHGWRTFVRDDNGVWAPGAELAAPDAAAGQFFTQPIASGDSLAVRGNNVVWVLTISPNPAPK